MKGILRALFGPRTVEYRLSDEDQQLMTALQFSNAVLLDEVQALSIELRALIELEERFANGAVRAADPKKGKGRSDGRLDGPDSECQGKGAL